MDFCNFKFIKQKTMRNFTLLARLYLLLILFISLGCRGVIKSAQKAVQKENEKHQNKEATTENLPQFIDEDNSTEKNIQEDKTSNKSKENKVSAAEKKARELEQCKNFQQFQIKKYGSARADCEDRTKEEAYRIYVQQNR